jgi:hypothetical protein
LINGKGLPHPKLNSGQPEGKNDSGDFTHPDSAHLDSVHLGTDPS